MQINISYSRANYSPITLLINIYDSNGLFNVLYTVYTLHTSDEIYKKNKDQEISSQRHSL